MIVAIKEEQEQTIGGMPEWRLEWHFDNWRRWMRKDDVTDGAPRKACGCVGGGYSQSFDDMVAAADVRCASIMDSLVNSLTPVERAAIYHEYLYAVFRLPRAELAEMLLRARTRLACWLVVRGVY